VDRPARSTGEGAWSICFDGPGSSVRMGVRGAEIEQLLAAGDDTGGVERLPEGVCQVFSFSHRHDLHQPADVTADGGYTQPKEPGCLPVAQAQRDRARALDLHQSGTNSGRSGSGGL
jgi:hypothetical protein